ncbi:NupC/NupG family nucleoside CNT transporter [Thermogutta sp.]|uniref:NupC/NupG family nucleoside CNT transporter n=1 Tax=Thermogutta sp. TaxID=1962930 RepID=UPI00321FF0C6
MNRLIPVVGVVVILFVAWLLSENRRVMHWRLILSGLFLQWITAFLFLRTDIGQGAFVASRLFIERLQYCVDQGTGFVFGPEGKHHQVAFVVLPLIIFVSSLTAILFHLGILQLLVKAMAKIMVWVMDVSGTESLAAAANVYVGMTEAPLVIRPYLESMTRSELMAMMSSGMATIAGTVMAAYVAMGVDAGHILTASLISAPAALVVAKIMVPETEMSPTKGIVRVQIPRQDTNILDAACRGASEGLTLTLNVAAMLIAFISLITLANWLLSLPGNVGGEPLSLERLTGYLFAPFAFLMGVDPKDVPTVAMLLGKRLILNEFIAYQELTALKPTLGPRSFTIATYALCGFANLGSIGVMIGGIGKLVPGRRSELAQLGFRSMIAGTLACYLTACIAAILL